MKKHILAYIEAGDITTVQTWLNEVSNPNLEVNNGYSLFSLACSSGHNNIIELLIKAGADVNHKSDSGNTTLHLICKYNRLETAEILLKHGADLSIKGQYNQTPYEVAQKTGHHAIVTMMDSYTHTDKFETEIIGSTEELDIA